jgi:tetratricopeptide (TPR) repeat protein
LPGSLLVPRCFRFAWFLVALPPLACSLATSVRGQFVVPPPPPSQLGAATIDEIEQATRAHLEQAQRFLAAEQWAEAVETVRRVMDTDGERLIALSDAADAPFLRFVTIRQYCQALMSRWSATARPALLRYRSELDPLAERWYQAAAEELDEQRLLDIVNQLFVTRRGDDALLLLGELALERGDYVQARSYFERISPALRAPALPATNDPAPGRPLWLAIPSADDATAWDTLRGALQQPPLLMAWPAYPDTDLDLAAVRARLVLVSVLERDTMRAEKELALLKTLHPDARGEMGGAIRPYAEALDELLIAEGESAGRPARDGWPTFAGSPSRQRIAEQAIDIGGRPLWRLPLPPEDATEDELATNHWRVAEDREATLPYFPVVSGRRVLIAQRNRLRAVDLYTGERLFGIPAARNAEDATRDVRSGSIYEAPTAPQIPLQHSAPKMGVARYSAMLHGSWLFARMGPFETRRTPLTTLSMTQPSFLVGLDLDAEGRLLPGFPRSAEGPDWAFEGSPLCDGRHLFVGLRRQDEVRVEAHVACYDVFSGRMLWKKQVCAAETPGQGRADEITHNLLTLDAGRLYYNTNLGVVACLSADDGQMQWLVRYPRSVYPPRPGQRAAHYHRAMTPALVHHDLVFVAPSDCDRLFALDAASGQQLWATAAQMATDVVHLLGVAEGQLIAGGDQLYWFDAYRGTLTAQFPPSNRQSAGFARATPRGYGRGVLAAGQVYWPTIDAIHVFHARPASTAGGGMPIPARAPMNLQLYGLRGGNLVVAEDVLLIAGAEELVALNPYGRIPKSMRHETGAE